MADNLATARARRLGIFSHLPLEIVNHIVLLSIDADAGQRLHLAQEGGEKSRIWGGAHIEHMDADKQTLIMVRTLAPLYNSLLDDPVHVTRFVIAGIRETFIFLTSWTPFELSRFGHIIVDIYLEPSTTFQMLSAMLAGIVPPGPWSEPERQSLTEMKHCHDHILGLLSHSSELREFTVQISMTEFFQDPQTYEATSTLDRLTRDLQLMERLFSEVAVEPGVPRSELRSLINLHCIQLELCLCKYVGNPTYEENGPIFNLSTASPGLPDGFGSERTSAEFWTDPTVRARCERLSASLKARRKSHMEQHCEFLLRDSFCGAATGQPSSLQLFAPPAMAAAYKASPLLVSGLWVHCPWTIRPDQPVSSRTRTCRNLTQFGTIRRR